VHVYDVRPQAGNPQHQPEWGGLIQGTASLAVGAVCVITHPRVTRSPSPPGHRVTHSG